MNSDDDSIINNQPIDYLTESGVDVGEAGSDALFNARQARENFLGGSDAANNEKPTAENHDQNIVLKSHYHPEPKAESEDNVDRSPWPEPSERELTLAELENKVRDGFTALDTLAVSNPHIDELREYGKHLEEKFAILRTSTGVSGELARHLIGEIREEDRKAEFEGVLLRIQHDTSYLKELADTNVLSGVIEGEGLENGEFGSLIQFMGEDSWLAKRLLPGNAAAGYSPMLDVTFVKGRPPTDEEIWRQLASEGTLPDIIASLDHEQTHDTQTSMLDRGAMWSPFVLGWTASALSAHFLGDVGAVTTRLATSKFNPFWGKLKERINGDPYLSEVHAYEAAASSPTSGWDQMDEGEEIAEHVVNNYEPSSDDTRFSSDRYDQAEIAYSEVHTLRLLGMDDRQIGHVVGRNHFDAKTKTYPSLKKAIDQRLQEWGITNEQDKETVLGALKTRQELEFHVARQKAKQIAARELKRASGHPNMN